MHGSPETLVKRVCTDSRQVQDGEPFQFPLELGIQLPGAPLRIEQLAFTGPRAALTLSLPQASATFVMIVIGEIIYGGVGSGLYGMLAFVIVAVFIAGLMVGRTPEYLGKKIEAFEMKMAAVVILVPPLVVLVGAAVAVATLSVLGSDGLARASIPSWQCRRRKTKVVMSLGSRRWSRKRINALPRPSRSSRFTSSKVCSTARAQVSTTSSK